MKYRILLQGQVGVDLLKDIKENHKMDIEGIGDLYNDLIENKACDSPIASRIYYVAYTLALRDIKMIIVQVK